MRTLERISVSGFKSIRELKDFELRQLNVLIGANGAGKSNFLKIFEMLHQVASQRLRSHVPRSGGNNAFLHFGQKRTANCGFTLQYREADTISQYQLELTPTVTDGLYISEERCWIDANRKDHPPLDRRNRFLNSQETFLPKDAPASELAQNTLAHLLDARPYHFGDTSESAHVKQIGDIGDNRALRPDASNLAAVLYLFQNHFPAHYQLIVETIRLVAPFFDDFALRPLPENPNKIRLEWRDNGSDNYLDASYLSDGTLRLICLTTLLSQPKLPALVIIDEPELGLHPSAINLLADMLAGAATKTQVLVSTQSVTLVNQFQPDDVIVVDRETGNTTFTRLDAEELSDWLNEYTLGELWEKNIFGGRP